VQQNGIQKLDTNMFLLIEPREDLRLDSITRQEKKWREKLVRVFKVTVVPNKAGQRDEPCTPALLETED